MQRKGPALIFKECVQKKQTYEELIQTFKDNGYEPIEEIVRETYDRIMKGIQHGSTERS